jgi:ribosomal protein L21E
MKRLVKLFGFVAVISCLISGCATQKIEKETHQFRYELEAAGVGAQGTYQIKVWTYSTRVNLAIEQAKKNAVHGVIFKGFQGKTGIVAGQKPMVADASIENTRSDYFKAFFEDGGGYQRFVSLVNNGAIAVGDRIKVGKEYKIGVVVSVNKDDLRKELENQGIIKKLGDIF